VTKRLSVENAEKRIPLACKRQGREGNKNNMKKLMQVHEPVEKHKWPEKGEGGILFPSPPGKSRKMR
jgi:hypothetical protein